MKKHHGATYTVKYLKTCQLALQKRISGDRIKSLREIEPDLPFPRLTTSGLPRIIPLVDRRSILSGNTFVIRYWMTVFSIYRVISVEGKLNLTTITAPFSGDNLFIHEGLATLKYLALKNLHRFDLKILSKDYGLLALETASPSYKSSWKGIMTDPFDLRQAGLDVHILEYLSATSQDRLKIYFEGILDVFVPTISRVGRKANTTMGQLSIKKEAAGKVRVFALVDVWTQSVLKPLHEMLFSFLRKLPNDGTFDQNASVQRCADKADKSGCSFGYDLSAATDRLPLFLQIAILTPIIGERAANAWAKLLTDRTYELKSEEFGDHSVRYAVGQPMGALSSWAMLAVSHHLIVQYSYIRARGPVMVPNFWYDNYELLGDDIVIFDKDVALAYLELMKLFGVGINLKKSVVATTNSFEFAKVSYSKGHFVSPVSWKMFVSQNTNMGRVNILYYLLNIRVLKHPIAFMKNILRKSLKDVGDYKFNLIALLSMYSNSGKMSYSELLKVLVLPIAFWDRSIKDAKNNLNVGYVESLLTSLYRKESLKMSNNEIINRIFNDDLPWHKLQLMNRIIMIRHRLGSVDDINLKLAGLIADTLIPGIPLHLKNSLSWMDNQLSKVEIDQATAFMMFYQIAESFLGDLSFYSVDLRRNQTLEDLIVLNAKFDRLLETLELTQRAIDKENGSTKNRISDRSPLSSLKFILKTNKRRPKWTFRLE
jgi:hypothetical protein